ncbi:hypothetical protein [Mycoplasmopsis gallinacea]|uniref:Lipoprotein n=1 Tax=Mycoplasmopsis gallinacea TaxID=29556 RepID=A0A6H0V3G9_9BACT|nr:hypothetical protein [Mycoplasmopsis gallinacea]QIW62239.1 hypothetical protein GOQ20_02200 [Mycoplasmopsis gallinacea]
MKLKGKFKFLTILSGVTVVSLPFAMISCQETQKAEKKETQPAESKPKEDTNSQPKDGGTTDSGTTNPETPEKPTNPENPGNEGTNPPAEENPVTQGGEQPTPENPGNGEAGNTENPTNPPVEENPGNQEGEQPAPENPGTQEGEGNNQGTPQSDPSTDPKTPSEETPTPEEIEAQKAAEEKAKNDAVVAKFQGEEGVARFAYTTEYNDERNESTLDFFYRDIDYNAGLFKDVTMTFNPESKKLISQIKLLVLAPTESKPNATAYKTQEGSRFDSFAEALGEDYILVSADQTKEDGQEFAPNYTLNGRYTFGEGFKISYKIAKRDGTFISDTIETTLPENIAPLPTKPTSFTMSNYYPKSKYDSDMNTNPSKKLLLQRGSKASQTIEIMYDAPKFTKNFGTFTAEQELLIEKVKSLRQRIISEFLTPTRANGVEIYSFINQFQDWSTYKLYISKLIFTLDKMLLNGYIYQEYYDLVYGKPTDGEGLNPNDTFQAMLKMKAKLSSSSSSSGGSSSSPYV